MTTNLQSALQAYLTAGIANLGHTLIVVCANTRDEAEPRDPRLVLQTRSLLHVAGPNTGAGGLYLLELAMHLETPALPAADTTGHTLSEQMLMEVMADQTEALTSALANAFYVPRGKYFRGWEDAPSGDAWGSAAVWRLGLEALSTVDIETFVQGIPAAVFRSGTPAHEFVLAAAA